jgi:Ca2+-binding EF-hand superfamily protein
MFKKSGIAFTLLMMITGCANQSNLNFPDMPQEAPAENTIIDDSQQAEANGWFDKSLRKIILDAMSRYDHDKSGSIEYRSSDTAWKTLIGKNENLKRVNSFSNTGGSATTYTMSKLFVASDINRDGISTEEEITTFISKTYDKNQDGTLQSRGLKFWKDKDEYQLFKSEVGEELKSITSISVPQNNTPNNQQGNIPNNQPGNGPNNSQGNNSNIPDIYHSDY